LLHWHKLEWIEEPSSIRVYAITIFTLAGLIYSEQPTKRRLQLQTDLKAGTNMGAYSKLNRPIVVVDYDPCWPVLFAQEKETLLRAIGDKVLQIEHIGSTSVPGLAAKPVIDIGVEIRSLSDAPGLFPCIERLEYVYEPALEQLLPERRFFWKGTPAIHTYHLHLTEVDNPVILKPIRFRDYLQKHPDAAREYGELKKELAERCRQDMDAYVSGKTAFVERILREAEREILERGANLK
jgi:GrpB-like predicted nucleotidyltransferase (UPF0157 family)